jgi:branched-chain amino acid aminotransferase
MKRFDLSDWPALAARLRQPYQGAYYAMYSSLYDGIVTDPVLMLLPMDDHMVHRGDGVFEALKLVDGRLYNLQAHLERLAQSAQAIALRLPRPLDVIRDVAVETARAGGRRDGTLRIFAARGPGGFSVNPYECPAVQLYVIVTAAGAPFMQAHPRGARVRSSAVPAKTGSMAAIKNCNYVPNVLMKKEAIDAGVDFTLGFDERGCLTEGATENVGIVAADGRLLFPRPERILAGTTMLRVIELAQELAAAGRLRGVACADIRHADLQAASELLLTGTTINVTAAVEFDGQPVGNGQPGPVWQALSELLMKDIHGNAALLTPVL